MSRHFFTIGTCNLNIKDLTHTLKEITREAIQTGRLLHKDPKERLSVCSTCEYFTVHDSRCQKCGCFMKAKVLFQGAHCPIQKW